jgi:hypothetical protein
MLSIVNILIVFFIFLIFYQLFLASNTIEGLENQYTGYDMNNPANALILAQQNAGNIAYLKERLDSYSDVYKQVQDLSGNYDVLEKQVNDLVAAQQDYVNQMTGGEAPEISGAVEEDEDGEGNQEIPSASDLITE